MPRTIALPFSLVLLAAIPAAAREPLDTLDDARAALQLVRDGDLSALEPARALLGRLSAAAPSDPLLLAYLGLATSYSAWHTPLPARAARLNAQAVELADEALRLAQAPGARSDRPDGEVLPLSASIYLTVARLHLLHAQVGEAGALARADALFARAAELTPDDPLPLAYRGTILTMNAGTAATERERGQALAQGLALAQLRAYAAVAPPDDPLAPAARARLATLAP